MEARSILLVEDNADDEALALRALRRSEVASSIRVARDGAEALDALFKNSGEMREFDLVLLDLKLPKRTGIEVLAEIRRVPSTATLPVVILTSSDEVNDILECLRLGANSYVRKPVDFKEYQETVIQVVHYWLVVNQV